MLPVLIAGGGPVGLSLAIRLSQMDIPVRLVERHERTATFPKGRALSVRSMEIFRGWGLEGDITAAGLSRDHLAFYTGNSLTDPHAVRIVTGPKFRSTVPSPTYTLLCSQDRLEPVLRAHAERLAPKRIHFATELIGFVDTDDHIVAMVRDAHTGQTTAIHAAYLIAADGARSPIREHLGIAMHGPTDVSHNLNILFNADLGSLVQDRLSAVYTINQPGLHGSFLAVDNDRRWLFNLIADGDDPGLADYDEDTCVRVIRAAAGLPDLALTLVDRQVWHAAAQVAERFRQRRVLLAGDAAHITTPYGGYGMNCGLADADNLAWKLAYVSRGWASATLLDTYHEERHPVAVASASESHQRLLQAIQSHHNGTPPRARPSEGLVLGYHYTSAAVIDDGSQVPNTDPVAEYLPSARPGHRAPHFWLDEETSTLDLIGSCHTLLCGPCADWAGTVHSPFPIAIHLVDNDDFLDLYGICVTGGVLIRPDGHVAWRLSCACPPVSGGRMIDEKWLRERLTEVGLATATPSRAPARRAPAANHCLRRRRG